MTSRGVVVSGLFVALLAGVGHTACSDDTAGAVDGGSDGGSLDSQADGTVTDGSSDGSPSDGGADVVIDSGAPGTFDTTFGTGGKSAYITPLFDAGSATTVARTVSVRNDGRVVVAGLAQVIPFVAQLDVSGALDPSFGVGGWFVRSSDVGFFPRGSVLLPSGTLRVGSGDNSSDGGALLQVLPNGSADTTFGTAGVAYSTPAPGKRGGFDAFLQDPSGSVLAGWEGTFSQTDFLVTRFLDDGGADPSFGTAGRALFPTPANTQASVVGLGRQSSGRMIVGGFQLSSSGAGRVKRVLGVLPGGALDSGFGSAGVVSFADATPLIVGLAVNADDSIIVVGLIEGTGTIVLWKLQANGALDTTFGVSGEAKTTLPFQAAPVAVALQKDGRILVTGGGYDLGSPQVCMLLARFRVDGTLDTSFAGGALRSPNAPVGEPQYDVGFALTIAPSGKIVVAGTSANNTAFSVWRVNP